MPIQSFRRHLRGNRREPTVLFLLQVNYTPPSLMLNTLLPWRRHLVNDTNSNTWSVMNEEIQISFPITLWTGGKGTVCRRFFIDALNTQHASGFLKSGQCCSSRHALKHSSKLRIFATAGMKLIESRYRPHTHTHTY